MPDLWYQEATINGIDMPTLRHKDSASYRWKTFINPHIPNDRGRAVDLGCNAGFYSRALADLGYQVTGVDVDTVHALFWESNHPKGIEIVRADINNYDISYASLALAACVLYWQSEDDLEALAEKLRHKVAHLIIMSRNRTSPDHLSDGTLKHMELIFRLWDKGEVISKGKHYSIAFHNRKILTLPTNNLTSRRGRVFQHRFNMLIDDVLSNKPFDPEQTPYYSYLRNRGVGSRIGQYINLIKSVHQQGITTPVAFCNGTVIDGAHRLELARRFGIKHLLCEDTSIG